MPSEHRRMPLPAAEHPLPIALLCCPDCGGALAEASAEDAFAACPACTRNFYRADGVHDLTPNSASPLTRLTVEQFGSSWQIHDHLENYHEQQFRDWIAPLTPDEFSGKIVLEAGCGKGRHSRLMGAWGPASLLCVDYSDAIVLAARNTAALDHVFCVRADLLHLPVMDGGVDLVVCVGVLHHLEDPEAGLAALWSKLKPGGTLCLWVYGREGNGWIVHGFDPLRKGISSRIPTRQLRYFAWPLSVLLFLALKLLYGPATAFGRRIIRWLPYAAYLGYISKFPFREIEHIVLDHLCPPLSCYLPRDTLESWFRKFPGAVPEFRWHNRNSWAVNCVKPTA